MFGNKSTVHIWFALVFTISTSTSSSHVTLPFYIFHFHFIQLTQYFAFYTVYFRFATSKGCLLASFSTAVLLRSRMASTFTCQSKRCSYLLGQLPVTCTAVLKLKSRWLLLFFMCHEAPTLFLGTLCWDLWITLMLFLLVHPQNPSVHIGLNICLHINNLLSINSLKLIRASSVPFKILYRVRLCSFWYKYSLIISSLNVTQSHFVKSVIKGTWVNLF